MASYRGPFKATTADMERARDYLAQRGIEYKGHSPKEAQRQANSVAKQEHYGLLPNRAAARGHGSTPEHPGRKVARGQIAPRPEVREAAPKAAGKELKVGTAADYARIRQQPNKFETIGDRRVYQGNERFALEGVKDIAFEGGRVDIKLIYADGVEQTLFTGADHKRNGEHAIDANTLEEMYEEWLEENPDGDFEEFLAEFADDEAYSDGQGTGGVVGYVVTSY